MTVKTLRWVDRWLGVPLCHVSAAAARLRPSEEVRPPTRWRAVVVVKFFGMGSILLSSPLVAGIRRLTPGARILFLTFARNREMAERLAGVDQVIEVRTENVAALVADSVAALFRIRRARPDAVFDLEFFSKLSSFAALVSGAGVRVGFALPARWRKALLTHSVELARNEHIGASFSRQLAAVGGLPDNSSVAITALEKDRAALRQQVDLPDDAGPIITVNINAGETATERRWAPERFIAVARKLHDTMPGAVFCFTGSVIERPYVDQALEQDSVLRKRSINCAGRLSLSGLIGLLDCSDVFLTNDTGPMHLSGALGTPTVALFGPESPSFYAPPGNVRIITRALPCSPCLNTANAKTTGCPYNAACMSAITVEEVFQSMCEVVLDRNAMVA